MKKILVSGASGIVGYGILRSLRKSSQKFKLIGTSIYEDSVAFAFCDIFEKAPLTNDKNYLDWLINIIKKYQVDMIIPSIEIDVYKWVNHITEIEKTGTIPLLNNKKLINLCQDKWHFAEKLKEINSPYRIETTINNNFDYLIDQFGLPFLLKPRQGYASQGIVRISDENTFSQYRQLIGTKLMVQPIIGKDHEEYTTSVFGDGKGGFFTQITLKRSLSKDGFTDKAEVVNIDSMSEVLISLCSYFKPLGPTNFQFRKDNNVFRLLEINPRISSSTSIRTSFGYNESEMAIDFFLENKEPEQAILLNGRAFRYVEDLIIYT